jgi:hypothetical protein
MKTMMWIVILTLTIVAVGAAVLFLLLLVLFAPLKGPLPITNLTGNFEVLQYLEEEAEVIVRGEDGNTHHVAIPPDLRRPLPRKFRAEDGVITPARTRSSSSELPNPLRLAGGRLIFSTYRYTM